MHRGNGGIGDNIGKELELREASSWAHFPRKTQGQIRDNNDYIGGICEHIKNKKTLNIEF